MTRRRIDRRTVGCVLRQFRQEEGLTQHALGVLAGLHRTYVGSAERGERNISFEALECWLAALEKTWEEFGRALGEARVIHE